MIGSETSQRIMLVRNGYAPRRPWYAYFFIALSVTLSSAGILAFSMWVVG